MRALSWNVSGVLWIVAGVLSSHDTYFVIGMLAIILAKLEEIPCDKNESN